MKFIIKRHDGGAEQSYEHSYKSKVSDSNGRPMALDVLLDAQEKVHPDLAYRYGCRNGLCGVCTIEVNGKPKLACRTKCREGDTLSHFSALPPIRDLVVRRDHINQQLRGRLPLVEHDPQAAYSSEAQKALVSLNRCIECYACLHGCPAHEKNLKGGSNRWGNPYSFLRIQKVMIDPSATETDKAQALNLARDLGISMYSNREKENKKVKVPGCGVGIDLKREVIEPLCSTIASMDSETNNQNQETP